MSSAVVTIYPKSVLFNADTYDSSTGGPIMAQMRYSGSALPDWTGDSALNQFLGVVNQVCTVGITIRDVKMGLLLVPGTKSSLVLQISGKGAAISITFLNMVFLGCEPAQQGRAQAGSSVLLFQHESADGSTAPVS